MFLKSGNKLTIQPKYTPLTTFLSPVQKCNHRSFSASSLQPSTQKITFSGSLRDQIRLDSFKKSVLTDSKLNKTALNKATLKVHIEQHNRGEDVRTQIRDLTIQISRLKQQVLRLNRQHSEDAILLARQNELIKHLENELLLRGSRAQVENPCQCYMSDQYVLTIKNLQLKIKHLEEEKREFKEQIRSLIVKQEELKYQLHKNDEKLSNEVRHNRKLQNMLYDENTETQKEKKKEKKKERLFQDKELEQSRSPKLNKSNVRESNSQSDYLKRYHDYLKSIRNHEIDKIESILKQ